MNTSITRIIFYLGNFRDIHNAFYFWLQNQEALEKEGFCHFPELDNHIFHTQNSAQDTTLFHNVHQSIHSRAVKASTLLIFANAYSLNPLALTKTLQRCQNFFPQAQIKAFYALAPQVYARRAVLFWAITHGHSVLNLSQQQLEIPAFSSSFTGITELQKLFKTQENQLHVHEGSLSSEKATLRLFCQYAGIEDHKHHCIHYAVPTEFLLLCETLYATKKLSPTEIKLQIYPLAMQYAKSTHPFALFANAELAQQFSTYCKQDTDQIRSLTAVPQQWRDTILPEEIEKNIYTTQEQQIQLFCTSLQKPVLAELYEALTALPSPYLSFYQRQVLKNCATFLNKPFTDTITPLEEATISVLTPTYNHKDFIAHNIESVLKQKLSVPFVHIIADDGSTDGTQEIILDYAQRYPHIVPLFQEKHSQGGMNYYTLFSHARSPFVALCDGDDFMTDPHKLQRQWDFLQAHPQCSLCFHPVHVSYEDKTRPAHKHPSPEQLPRGICTQYYLSDLFKSNFIQTSSVMYRWRFQKGLAPWFTTNLKPGDWYWHLLHAELGYIGFINEAMSVYRRHEKALFFTSENEHSFEEHYAKHGMAELQVYATVNAHFHGKYLRALKPLFLGVFSNFLKYYKKTNNDTLLQKAIKKYPLFGQCFLEYIQSTQKQNNS